MENEQPIEIPMNDLEGSSLISGHGHHAETNTLRLRFPTGAVYDYANVDPEKYADFMAAESKGKWAHEHLRGEAGKKHPFKQIVPPTPKKGQ